MRLNELQLVLAEGGNIFKDKQGKILTQRINLADIEPTLRWLESITKIPLVGNTLGSVGKKDSSGDLDLAVDQNNISKEELIARLAAYIKKGGGEPEGWIKKAGISVHFLTPIKGNPKLGFVQTDFMFGPNIEQMKFGLHAAGDASKYTGADRNLLMSSIAKSMPNGLKYSWQKGLMNRATGDIISTDPDTIASTLLGKGATLKDLDSVETIMSFLKRDPARVKMLKALTTKLQSTKGKKPGEVKADAEEAARIAKILGFLKEQINEGIDHPEDLIIAQGSKGAQRALNDLAELGKNTKLLTIKWDGMPAVVFGRDDKGQLVFVDKHMYEKVVKNKIQFSNIESYDKSRGVDRTNLWDTEKIYRDRLESVVPKGKNKFWMGDLLWTGTPKIENGFYVFKPNTVEYRVAANSPLGKKIGASVGGIAVHTFIPGLGEPDQALKGLGGLRESKEIVLLTGEMSSKPKISVDKKLLERSQTIIKDYAPVVDKFISDLEAVKGKSILSAMSPFITSMLNDMDISNDIVPRFLDYLRTKLNPTAAKRFLGDKNDGWLYQENGGGPGLLGIWTMWAAITELKLNIKKQIDTQQQNSEVIAITDGADSHEGYVFGQGENKIKIVDRLGFSRANFHRYKASDSEIEAKSKMPLAVFCFGRMNPPTLGHAAVMQKTVELGGANSFIFLGNTHNNTTDPLDPAAKAAFISQMYPQFASRIVKDYVINPIHAANWLYDRGFRNMMFVAGSDRLGKGAGSIENLLNSWNSGLVRSKDFARGLEGREHVVLRFASSGERDADTSKISGISGTLARKYAAEGNEKAFQQATGVDSRIKVGGKTLYQAVRNGMGIKESITDEDAGSNVLDKKTPTVSELATKYKKTIPEINHALGKGIKVEMEHTNDVEVAREIALDHLGEHLDYYDMLKKVEKYRESYVAKLEGAKDKKISKVLDKPSPTVGELAEKYHTSLGMIEQELERGTKVEMEHTNDPEVARKIALDHLSEKLDYYKLLAKVEHSKKKINETSLYTFTEGSGIDQVAGIGMDGKSYRFKIKDLIAKTQKYPVQNLNPKIFTQQLADIEEPEDSQKKRTAAAELQYPIIVVKNGKNLHIADGTHRVRKALAQNLPTIKARVIPLEDMDDFLAKDVVETFENISEDNEEAKPRVYLDMDGVLADFFGEWAKISGVDHYKDIENVEAKLQLVREHPSFWTDLPLMPNAKELIKTVVELYGEYYICTKLLEGDPRCISGKQQWIKENLSDMPPKGVVITSNKEKYARLDNQPCILVDDYGPNINAWRAAGGIGLKYSKNRHQEVIKILESLSK